MRSKLRAIDIVSAKIEFRISVRITVLCEAAPFAESMDARVAPTAMPRRGPAGDGIVSVLRSWRPSKTPRVTGGLFLWLFGLWAALYAAAPPVSPQAQTEYLKALNSADGLRYARGSAVAELAAARYSVYAAKDSWLWRFDGNARARVAAARVEEAKAQRVVDRAHAEWMAAQRQAKRKLGLWSDVGVAEARREFWSSYAEGKLFAQRHTMWDVVFAVMTGRTGTEDSVLSFVLNWVGIALTNFTAGMLSAVLSFMFKLPGIIWSYGAGIFSGALFFFIASVAASSVVTAYLGALYGTAAIGTYYAVKASGAQPRLVYSQRSGRYVLHSQPRQHAD